MKSLQVEAVINIIKNSNFDEESLLLIEKETNKVLKIIKENNLRDKIIACDKDKKFQKEIEESQMMIDYGAAIECLLYNQGETKMKVRVEYRKHGLNINISWYDESIMSFQSPTRKDGIDYAYTCFLEGYKETFDEDFQGDFSYIRFLLGLTWNDLKCKKNLYELNGK